MHREDFPILKNNKIIYFDNGATTLKPSCVKKALNDYYDKYTASTHSASYKISHQVTQIYENCRQEVRDFINAKDSSEIVFTSGSTQALNMIIFGYFAHYLQKGDEVLITLAEHASNVLPWFVLQKELGILIKYIPLDAKGEVKISNIKKVITSHTKVISIAHITNTIGDVRDLEKISKLCHNYDTLLVVDASQSIAHEKIDVKKMNIDFLTFSAHKIYGPTGIGVLYGKNKLLKDLYPTLYGGGMNATFNSSGHFALKDIPERLECGTPNIEGVLGLYASLKYIRQIGLKNIYQYEHNLRKYLVTKLSQLNFIKIYNKDNEGTTVIFNIDGIFSQDTAIYLDKYGICIRAGDHCAKLLKEVIQIDNTCRISLSFYNTRKEIDYLIKVLKNSHNIWKEIL